MSIIEAQKTYQVIAARGDFELVVTTQDVEVSHYLVGPDAVQGVTRDGDVFQVDPAALAYRETMGVTHVDPVGALYEAHEKVAYFYTLLTARFGALPTHVLPVTAYSLVSD